MQNKLIFTKCVSMYLYGIYIMCKENVIFSRVAMFGVVMSYGGIILVKLFFTQIFKWK
jgi:hypothetical protein